MHHRLIVTVTWIVLFFAGMFAAGNLSDRLSLDFSLPGQPGDDTEQLLMDNYGVSTGDMYIATITLPAGQTVIGDQDQIGQLYESLHHEVPQTRMVDFATTGDKGFISVDGRTTYALFQAPLPRSLGPGIEQQLDPALEK